MFLTTTGLLLSLVSMTLMPTTAFANGRGYGGADYSTTSIPLELDHALYVEDIKAVENQCQAKYLQPLFEEMCSRVNGVINLKEYNYVQQCDSMKSINFVKPRENIVLLEFYPGAQIDNMILVEYKPDNKNERTSIKAKLSTIEFNYLDIIESGSYDDFGIYAKSKNTVKKISIQRAQNNYFKNNRTLKITSFLLQSERIAECYENEIQKLLSK